MVHEDRPLLEQKAAWRTEILSLAEGLGFRVKGLGFGMFTPIY